MSRLGAAWVRPTSVDPGDLVNRDAEREQLLSVLEDYRNTAMEAGSASAREARILISGERGVGKSILTRKVLADFGARHPDQVIIATINARGLRANGREAEAKALVEQATQLV